MLKVNEKYHTKIIKQEHNGRGLTKIDGIPVFVYGALPNDEVEILITEVHHHYAIGDVLTITHASNCHINSPCPYSNMCGGCDIIYEQYDKQIEFKKLKVMELLNKIGHIDFDIKCIYNMQTIYNYRNKITFHVNHNNIGLYAKKTNELVCIDQCLLASPLINKVYQYIRSMDLDNITEVMIRSSLTYNQVMVVLVVNQKVNLDYYKKYLMADRDIKTVIIKDNNGYQTIYGDGYITDRINDINYQISAASFFQVNTTQSQVLMEVIKKLADLKKEDVILDLYCGIGTIGLYLSRYCKTVVGVEIVQEAITDAIANAKLNDINNVHFISGASDDVVLNLNINFDVIIVDPPRAGLTPKTIQFIVENKPKKIVYVSCNPATLARDLGMLKHAYTISDINLVDMFPNTSHVEAVSVLGLR